MPIEDRFIAEIAAHVIAEEKSRPDEHWGRYGRREVAESYIKNRMEKGDKIAEAHFSLDASDYATLFERVEEIAYRALVERMAEQRLDETALDRNRRALNRRFENGTIPPQIYDTYHLYYNNTTYRAFREALEEAARFGALHVDQSNEEFIVLAMNLLIDASLERCHAALYEGIEAQLREMLRPLDSRLLGLAMRHLDNFGSSLVTEATLPVRHIVEMLNITRAELSGYQHDVRRSKTYRAEIAAAWLNVAGLLMGAAVDVLTDELYHSLTWRRGARDKFAAALLAVKQGIEIAQETDFTLPEHLPDVLAQILKLFPAPDDSAE